MPAEAPSPGTLAVVIAGGGTGGHLYPGLAVARELLRQRPDARVSFAGTARGLEARVIPAQGFALDVIRSAGLKGKSIAARVRGALLLGPSLLDAWRLLSRRRPRVVMGVGGYSSGPVVLLAALRGIPTIVLEQNVVPGLTNRLLARIVRAAAVSYEETRAYFGDRALLAGNPVRAEFFSKSDVRPDPGGAGRVLVIGGSQGAHAINTAMIDAASRWGGRCPGLQIVHQTGTRDLAAVREASARAAGAAGVQLRAEPFLDDVAGEMAAADLVVCRAGSTTLAELAAVGRPAVIVPLPTATDDHQRRNARVLVEAGAAVMIDQRDLTPDHLVATVADLLADRGRLRGMAVAMHAFARPEAAGAIVARVLELAR